MKNIQRCDLRTPAAEAEAIARKRSANCLPEVIFRTFRQAILSFRQAVSMPVRPSATSELSLHQLRPQTVVQVQQLLDDIASTSLDGCSWLPSTAENEQCRSYDWPLPIREADALSGSDRKNDSRRQCRLEHAVHPKSTDVVLRDVRQSNLRPGQYITGENASVR
jgi:hypothetical protein